MKLLLFTSCLILATIASGHSGSAAPVAPSTGIDARCTAEVTSPTALRFRCYFDPVRNATGIDRFGYMTETSPGTLLLGPFTYLQSPFIDATVYNSSGNAPGQRTEVVEIGAAAGLPVGAARFIVSYDAPHGVVAGQTININVRLQYSPTSAGNTIRTYSTEPTVQRNVPVVADGVTQWPSDWYPGGAAVAPADACSGLTLTFANETATFLPGESMQLSVVNPPTNPVASLEARLSANRPFQGVFSGQIGPNGSYTLPVGDGPPVKASEVQFKCVRLNGSIGYMFYGSGTIGTAASVRGCTAARVYWPAVEDSFLTGPGDSFRIVVDYTGPFGTSLETITVRARFRNDLALGVPGAQPDEFFTDTWVNLGSFASGSRTDVDLTAPNLDPFPLRFDAEAIVALECTDSTGKVFNTGTWSPSFVKDRTERNCSEQSDLSFAPSSWVPGVLRGVRCVAEVVFVPDGRLAQEKLKALRSDLDANAPFTWVTGGYDALTDAMSGAQTGLDNALPCAQIAPAADVEQSQGGSAPPIALPALEACVPEGFTTGPYQIVRRIAGAAVWIGLAFTMSALLFAPPKSDAPEQLTLF